MKTKPSRNKVRNFILLFICCTTLLLPRVSYAQSSCFSAIPLSTPYTDSLQNSQEEWFSFVAFSSAEEVKLFDLAPSQAGITNLEVFSGACSSLSQIGIAFDTIPPSDSLVIPITGLTIGNTYYLKVKRNDPVSCGSCSFGTFAPFDVLLTVTAFISIDGAFGNCTQTASSFCTVTVCQGQQLCFSLDYVSELQGGVCKWNVTGSSCPSVINNAATDTFCCTFPTIGTFYARVRHTSASLQVAYSPTAIINVIQSPNATLSISDSSPCMGDTVCFTVQSNVSTYDSSSLHWIVDGLPYSSCNNFGCSSTLCFPDPIIFSTPSLNPGIHTVSVIVNNLAGCIDTVTQTFTINTAKLSFTHDDHCHMSFDADTSCPNAYVSYHWDFGDPASGMFDTTNVNPAFHDFSIQGGTYTVTLTAVDIFGNTQTYIAVVRSPNNPNALISGIPANNCGGTPMVYNAPCVSGVTYGWIVLNGSSISISPYGCTATINWNTLGDTLILVATDTVRDCISRDTIYIPKCCDVPGQFYNPITHVGKIYLQNTSATAVLNNPAYSFLISGTTFSTVANNNQIIINGVFTIDTTFSFYLCNHVDPGGNALIDVKPTRTFTIDSSTVDNQCDIMWEGILVTDSTAKVNIIRSSLVRNARNCVHSVNGGRYFIERSELRNDVRNVVVEFFSNNNPSIVRQTKFKFVGGFLPAVPALPTWEQKSYVGIYITDNKKITVGDTAKVVYQNTFDNLYNGIQITRSGVNIYNNNFKNITFNSLAPSTITTGFGIDAKGGRTLIGNRTLNIGSPTNLPTTQNSFNTCTDATRAFAVGTTTIMGNTFVKISHICMDINSPSGNLTIYRNFINAGTTPYNIAIFIRNSGNGRTIITNNNIIQASTLMSTNRVGIGILFESTNPVVSPAIARIKYNTVNRNRVGIWIRNVQPVANDSIVVRQNNIDMVTNWNIIGAPTVPHTGISLQSCKGIFADSNTVQTAGTAAPTGSDTLVRGILVENTTLSVLSDNIIKKMQSGIMVRNNAINTYYVCNTLQKNNNGFFFTGNTGSAISSDQIHNPNSSLPAPTGNHFLNNANFDLKGSIFPSINWYFDPSNLIGATSITGVNFSSLSSSLLICGQFYLPPFGGGGGGTTRTAIVGNAIAVSTQTTDSGAVYYNNLYSLRQLRMTQSWLSLNLADDTVYQNFYAAKNNSCMGGLCSVDENICSGHCALAASINAGLNPICIKDQNQKMVNEIYFRSWDAEQIWFTPQDSAALLGIALMNPQEGGEAVYGARVMLGLDQEEYGAYSSLRISQIKNETTEGAFKIYPNPASDVVTLEYNVSEGQAGTYQILNLSGQLIQSGRLQNGITSQQISTSQLDGGVYMICVAVNGEMIGNEKLVIIRQ